MEAAYGGTCIKTPFRIPLYNSTLIIRRIVIRMFLLLVLLAAASAAYSTTNSTAHTSTTGSRGNTRCTIEHVQVSVTSENTKLLLAEPANQTIATGTFQELLQNNSNLFARVNGGPNTVTGKFRIYGKLCFPSDAQAAKRVQTLQFLTHGDTLDHTYWEIAPGYSYIDAAVAAGYATFSYDRIGVGKSEHPDPNQVVQGPIQVEIAHGLVTLLRSAQIGSLSFKNIVGVGHSAGSTVTNGVTTKYPQDFDAVILTGTSTSAAFVRSLDLATAIWFSHCNNLFSSPTTISQTFLPRVRLMRSIPRLDRTDAQIRPRHRRGQQTDSNFR